MKPDHLKYGVGGVLLIMGFQWMTGTFDDNQTKMLENQNLMITTMEHSNSVQEAMLKQMETGNNLARRRVGIKIEE